MAKPAKTSESSPPSATAAPSPRHSVKLAHPDEMAAVLDAMAQEGWQIITIVSCRHTHEHAAYFRRD